MHKSQAFAVVLTVILLAGCTGEPRSAGGSAISAEASAGGLAAYEEFSVELRLLGAADGAFIEYVGARSPDGRDVDVIRVNGSWHYAASPVFEAIVVATNDSPEVVIARPGFIEGDVSAAGALALVPGVEGFGILAERETFVFTVNGAGRIMPFNALVLLYDSSNETWYEGEQVGWDQETHARVPRVEWTARARGVNGNVTVEVRGLAMEVADAA